MNISIIDSEMQNTFWHKKGLRILIAVINIP